jgi:hypothetical protein
VQLWDALLALVDGRQVTGALSCLSWPVTMTIWPVANPAKKTGANHQTAGTPFPNVDPAWICPPLNKKLRALELFQERWVGCFLKNFRQERFFVSECRILTRWGNVLLFLHVGR